MTFQRRPVHSELAGSGLPSWRHSGSNPAQRRRVLHSRPTNHLIGIQPVTSEWSATRKLSDSKFADERRGYRKCPAARNAPSELSAIQSTRTQRVVTGLAQ